MSIDPRSSVLQMASSALNYTIKASNTDSYTSTNLLTNEGQVISDSSDCAVNSSVALVFDPLTSPTDYKLIHPVKLRNYGYASHWTLDFGFQIFSSTASKWISTGTKVTIQDSIRLGKTVHVKRVVYWEYNDQLTYTKLCSFYVQVWLLNSNGNYWKQIHKVSIAQMVEDNSDFFSPLHGLRLRRSKDMSGRPICTRARCRCCLFHLTVERSCICTSSHCVDWILSFNT